MAICATLHFAIRVWSIVYLCRALREPPADKRNAPHFFLFYSPFWGRRNNKTVVMKETMKYVRPVAEELDLNTESIICTSSEGTGEEDW